MPYNGDTHGGDANNTGVNKMFNTNNHVMTKEDKKEVADYNRGVDDYHNGSYSSDLATSSRAYCYGWNGEQEAHDNYVASAPI